MEEETPEAILVATKSQFEFGQLNVAAISAVAVDFFVGGNLKWHIVGHTA